MTNRKLINQLIQLQELIVARMQKKVVMPQAPLDALDKNIAQLSADLPQAINSHLNRLLKKHPEAVVPFVDGHCTGCGMGVSASLINEIRHADELHRCLNCTRYLYCPSEIVAREHASRVYGEKRKIGLARFSAQSLMVSPLTGDTPEEALGQLCSRMQQEGFVFDGGQLLEMALQRETIISTAVDSGMAFPHVRGVEGGGLTMALGVHKKGIHFGGPGRTLTRLFFFMVIPTATSAFYLKLISGLSQIFREKEAREALLAADSEEALWSALMRQTRKVIK
ncbi:PTS sugar transporter subunit IIA [Pontiella sulfatireligans]|uniref:PTS system mannose-specific EIIBCA component n=1 Tax=Pontiella sulfatireligans TaxID=2750658 RepID=A0A6C2UKH9_9BACT|nr:PTS sugar transporter subunit IIA [Pontiella sulfatireligans]VGO20608.1 PTS system mannose-specific EIIBCA component [Pontiella sulfatireligans]